MLDGRINLSPPGSHTVCTVRIAAALSRAAGCASLQPLSSSSSANSEHQIHSMRLPLKTAIRKGSSMLKHRGLGPVSACFALEKQTLGTTLRSGIEVLWGSELSTLGIAGRLQTEGCLQPLHQSVCAAETQVLLELEVMQRMHIINHSINHPTEFCRGHKQREPGSLVPFQSHKSS